MSWRTILVSLAVVASLVLLSLGLHSVHRFQVEFEKSQLLMSRVLDHLRIVKGVDEMAQGEQTQDICYTQNPPGGTTPIEYTRTVTANQSEGETNEEFSSRFQDLVNEVQQAIVDAGGTIVECS